MESRKTSKIIGFANKYYTLWEITTRQTTVNGFYEEREHFNYIKNISFDWEKVQEQYPDLPFDENLKGSRSFHRTVSKKFTGQMTFGKYRDDSIESVIEKDFDYALWVYDNAYQDEVREYMDQLPEIIEWKRQKQEETDRLIKEGYKYRIPEGVVTVKFRSNPYEDRYDGYNIVAKADIDGVNSVFHFGFENIDLIENYYGRRFYALVNGERKVIKNKTVKLDVSIEKDITPVEYGDFKYEQKLKVNKIIEVV